jgi:hypothetical protein
MECLRHEVELWIFTFPAHEWAENVKSVWDTLPFFSKPTNGTAIRITGTKMK